MIVFTIRRNSYGKAKVMKIHDVIELMLIFGNFIVDLIKLVLDLIDRKTQK